MPDRRSFMGTFLTGAAAAAFVVPAPSSATAADLFARMSWLNPPARWLASGGHLTVVPRPHTDFWRETGGWGADNAAFFHLDAPAEFTFSARVGGQHAEQYDQTGIALRLGAETWMKCGTEMCSGRRSASVVVTRGDSDWSVMPDLTQTAPVWWRVERHLHRLDMSVSADGKDYALVRSADFPASDTARVGIYCSAPGEQSFEATFDDLRLDMSRGA